MKQAALQPNPLPTRKFSDPQTTANGAPRARVSLRGLETLWINTGTLCNLTCRHCYIESSPRNDRLVYISASEAVAYLNEIERDGWHTTTIGFTGGEPFMNPELARMLEEALTRGFRVLVLTNAMKPMMKRRQTLLALRKRYGSRLTLRVSIDHYTQPLHESERGRRTWAPTLEGLQWLARNGFALSVAARTFSGETQDAVRRGYQCLFDRLDIALDAFSPTQLILFPEMDADADVAEITEACWGILEKSPDEVMCASSRMVVKRRGEAHPVVVSCTLLPYDKQFELGRTLADANTSVALNHPHCARFCVLGGASCSQ
ncbi:MAG TPA: radical SAM protein [Gammaproteobacteria bacterium]|nr:radical SAM protein [Gammaproteobacteria bacterium]